ncbi:hypothetical protein DMENIID0001_076220 [Sergentomyia squamirostris]
MNTIQSVILAVLLAAVLVCGDENQPQPQVQAGTGQQPQNDNIIANLLGTVIGLFQGLIGGLGSVVS